MGPGVQGVERRLHLESGGSGADKGLCVDGDVEVDACLGRGGQREAITSLKAEERPSAVARERVVGDGDGRRSVRLHRGALETASEVGIFAL